jgi:hypothetical protein
MVEWLQTVTLIFAVYAIFNNYNSRIDNTDNDLKQKITKIEARLENIEKTQERLMNRIYSQGNAYHYSIAARMKNLE